MHKPISHFFVEYPQWIHQFRTSHWTQTYYIQQLREFPFELLVIELWSCNDGEAHSPTLTMAVAQDALESFYYRFATDREELVAEHLAQILFWLGDSGHWESELHRNVHAESVAQVVAHASQRARGYGVHLGVWLLTEGFDALKLADESAWETLTSEEFLNSDLDYAYEFYTPPALVWKQHLLHPWLVVSDSRFIYPH